MLIYSGIPYNKVNFNIVKVIINKNILKQM